jgi:hypothetical protein
MVRVNTHLWDLVAEQKVKFLFGIRFLFFLGTTLITIIIMSFLVFIAHCLFSTERKSQRDPLHCYFVLFFFFFTSLCRVLKSVPNSHTLSSFPRPFFISASFDLCCRICFGILSCQSVQMVFQLCHCSCILFCIFSFHDGFIIKRSLPLTVLKHLISTDRIVIRIFSNDEGRPAHLS